MGTRFKSLYSNALTLFIIQIDFSDGIIGF